MVKRGFIRALWGDPDDTSQDEGWTTPSARRHKMEEEINLIMDNPHTEPFRTYIFGRANYDHACSLGVPDCVLLCDAPSVYDMQTQFWRHKLDILKYAMEQDGYDEIVYLDWDCIPTQPLLDNFWAVLSMKHPFQANLMFYRRRKCHWRSTDVRKVSNGGFLYIGDRSYPQAIIDTYLDMDKMHQFWDETAYSQFTDNLVGGWKGLNVYWENFEPEVCNLKKKSPFTDEQVLGKDFCFLHYIQSANNKQGKYYQGGRT